MDGPLAQRITGSEDASILLSRCVADPDRARAAAEAAVAALVEVDALTAATIATRYGLANRAAEILAHG